jgi:hypothetical protein
MLRHVLPLAALGLTACNVVIGLNAFSKADTTASAGSGGQGGAGASPIVLSTAILGNATPEGPIVALGADYLLYGLVADGDVGILNQKKSGPPAPGGVYGLFGDIVGTDATTAQASPFTWERLGEGTPHAMDATTAANGTDGWVVAATQADPAKPVNLTAYRRRPEGMLKVPLSEVTAENSASFQKLRIAVSPNGKVLYVAAQFTGTINVKSSALMTEDKFESGSESSLVLLKYGLKNDANSPLAFAWSFCSLPPNVPSGSGDMLAGLAATNDRALLLAEVGTAPNPAGFGFDTGVVFNGAFGKRAGVLLKVATANDGSANFQPTAQADVLACGVANDGQNSVHPLGLALCSTNDDETEVVVAFTSTCEKVAAGSPGSGAVMLTDSPFTHAKGRGRVAFAQFDTKNGLGSVAKKHVVLDLGDDGNAEGEVTAMSVGPSVDGEKGVLIGGHFFKEVRALDAKGNPLNIGTDSNGEPIPLPLPETAGNARQAFVLQLAPGTSNGVGRFFVTSPAAPSTGSATVTSLSYQPKTANLGLGVRVANGEVTFLGSTLQAAENGAARPYLHLLSDMAFAPSSTR